LAIVDGKPPRALREERQLIRLEHEIATRHAAGDDFGHQEDEERAQVPDRPTDFGKYDLRDVVCHALRSQSPRRCFGAHLLGTDSGHITDEDAVDVYSLADPLPQHHIPLPDAIILLEAMPVPLRPALQRLERRPPLLPSPPCWYSRHHRTQPLRHR